LEHLRAKSRVLPDLATERFAATGMQRVSAAELKSIQDDLRGRMESAGYPDGGVEARAAVDKAIAKGLAELELPTGEMLRSDVWTWLTIHLLPDYLSWRWAKPDGIITEARFGGSIHRNALGRLWLRGVVFDRGVASLERWGLMERIPEDAALAILERTTVSADHRLARSVAQSWLDTGTIGSVAEDLLRRTMILLRVQAALIETSALGDVELKQFTDKAFEKVATKLNDEQ
jgi:hypothetical protein